MRLPVSREESVALVERLLGAAERRDVSTVSSMYAEDAVAVSPVFGEVRGRAAIAATWETLFRTLTDVTLVVSDILVDGDRVAVLSTLTTSDAIGWFGRPATGGPIGYRLVLLLTVADGAIVRDERIYDSVGVVERLEKAQLDKELRLAAEVQQALVSRAGHAGTFCESVGDSVPCRAIGGDFFSFLDLPSGDTAIVMGDVAGKGPAAALLAALIQGIFAVEAEAGDTPARTVSRVNRRLADRTLGSRFATLVYATLSREGRLTYTNAGHNAPILLTGGGVQRLTVGGTILGAFADAAFDEATINLRPLDTLVLFTDGVTEARSVSDEEFGEERLLTCLTDVGTDPPIAVLNRIVASVQAFAHDADQNDDITITVSRFS